MVSWVKPRRPATGTMLKRDLSKLAAGIPARVPTANPRNQSTTWRVRTVLVGGTLNAHMCHKNQLISVVTAVHIECSRIAMTDACHSCVGRSVGRSVALHD